MTWALNASQPAGKDADYKNVKVSLCYAPVSQKEREWRKTPDDLKKDKPCQFKVAQQPYAGAGGSGGGAKAGDRRTGGRSGGGAKAGDWRTGGGGTSSDEPAVAGALAVAAANLQDSARWYASASSRAWCGSSGWACTLARGGSWGGGGGGDGSIYEGRA